MVYNVANINPIINRRGLWARETTQLTTCVVLRIDALCAPPLRSTIKRNQEII